jgi:lipid-A-disaccharide synthase
MAPRMGMVAGEASGDLLAGLLLGGLKQRFAGLQSFGIGGPKMAAQGFDAWWPHHKLSVFGFVDALRHYRELSGIRDQLGDRLLADKPDVFGAQAEGGRGAHGALRQPFDLGLARRAH